jgi:hypothetical protein
VERTNQQIINYCKTLFNKIIKNIVSLGSDSSLESDFKPLKVGGENTPIEISKTGVKVNGLEVQTGTSELNDLSDVTYSAGSLTIDDIDTLAVTGDFKIDISDDELTLDSTEDIKFDRNGTTIYTFELDNQKIKNHSSNDFHIDVVGDIKLDANGSDIIFNKSGTDFGKIDMGTTSTLELKSETDFHLNLISQGTGDIVLDSGGDVVLDSNDGNFIAKKAGTEFSVANSAYAGMILGYTKIQNLDDDADDNKITVSNSFAVIETVAGTKANVSFVAPPSGNVEIFFSANIYSASRNFYFSLSDNSTYNELNEIHTYDNFGYRPDETDYNIASVYWTVTGLTAGTSYQYWIGAKCSTSSGYIYHGKSERFSLHAPPIIVKATALPGTIVTGE